MRVTSKGQVTIPAELRERGGFLPGTEVEFILGDGNLQLVKAQRGGLRKTCGQALVAQMRGRADTGMSTDEIMALTRGE